MDTSRSARAFPPESWRESEGSRQAPKRRCETKARTDRTSEQGNATYPDQRDRPGGVSRRANDHQRTCPATPAEAAQSGSGRTHHDETSSSRVRPDARDEASRARPLPVSHRASVGRDSTDDLSAVFRSRPEYRVEDDGPGGGGAGLGPEVGDQAATAFALPGVNVRGAGGADSPKFAAPPAGDPAQMPTDTTDITFHYPPELFNLLVDAVPLLNKTKKDVLLFFTGAGVADDILRDLRQRLSGDPNRKPVGKPQVSEHLVRLMSRDQARGFFISASDFTEPAIQISREFLQHKVVAPCHLQELVLGASVTVASGTMRVTAGSGWRPGDRSSAMEMGGVRLHAQEVCGPVCDAFAQARRRRTPSAAPGRSTCIAAIVCERADRSVPGVGRPPGVDDVSDGQRRPGVLWWPGPAVEGVC